MRIVTVFLFTTMLAGSLAGCGSSSGSDSGTPPPPPPPPSSGLDARPSNKTCIAPDRPTSTLTAAAERVFPSLSFTSPVALLQAPGDASRWFVVEQAGRILAFDNSPTVAATSTFLDIRSRVLSGGEQGLLGA